MPVKICEFICDRLLHYRLTVGPPSYDLHKISDTQSILMYHSVIDSFKNRGPEFSTRMIKN